MKTYHHTITMMMIRRWSKAPNRLLNLLPRDLLKSFLLITKFKNCSSHLQSTPMLQSTKIEKQQIQIINIISGVNSDKINLSLHNPTNPIQKWISFLPIFQNAKHKSSSPRLFNQAMTGPLMPTTLLTKKNFNLKQILILSKENQSIDKTYIQQQNNQNKKRNITKLIMISLKTSQSITVKIYL